VKLIWKKRMKDRVAAMKMEYKIKRMPKNKKEELIKSPKKK
jgi:predicted GIY-YIG superfamily endonuclease